MRNFRTPRTVGIRPLAWTLGLAAAGALASAAIVNAAAAKRAEARYPPIGDYVTIDGVRLHYVDRGAGTPVVLVHGNGTMLQDWIVSGMLDTLAQSHRVIAFDRPGFGYSARPRLRTWTPVRQAKLIAEALQTLGVGKALVVGHSLGAQIAIALALDHREVVDRLALLGGYYFATPRADAVFALPAALPLVGDIMSHTVSPLLGAAMTPQVSAKLFAPAATPARWKHDFPFGLMLRPSQIRAESADGAMMVPTAAKLSKRYSELILPVTIIAGAGDRIADPLKQSRRLHETIGDSQFSLVEGSGHMVHHTGLAVVLAALQG